MNARFFPVLFFFGLILPLQAQFVQIGYGYGIHFYDFGGFNEVIDRYNGAHVLDEAMPDFTYLDGFSFQFTAGKARWLFSYGTSAGTKVRKALYTAGNDKFYRRALRMRNIDYKLGIGYLIAKSKRFALVLGLEGIAGRLRVDGRVYGVGDGRPEWDEVEKDWNFGASPSLMFIFGKKSGIAVVPYYVYYFTDSSADFLDKALNASANLPAMENPNVVLHHYGLRLMFSFHGMSDGALPRKVYDEGDSKL